MQSPGEVIATPDLGKIEIEYATPLNDHLDEVVDWGLCVYQFDRRTLLKKTWLTALICSFAALGFAWIMLWAIGSSPSHPDARILVVAGALGVWFLYSLSSPTKQSKRMRIPLREISKATVGCYLGQTRLTLTGESIEYVDCFGSAIYPWESVYEIHQNERGFSVMLANHRYIFVPSSADPNGRAAEFAKRQVTEHDCPNPAAAKVIGDSRAVCPRCRQDMSGNRSAICPNCDCRLTLSEISKARCLGEA